MRILIVDIETKPSLAYVWALWDQNVSLNQLVEAGEMISWAAKWVGEPEVEFQSTFHNGKKTMVRGIWKLLDQADVVMHFNGKKFDIPHIQREFLEMELPPPSPFKQIDLLQTVRTQFRFVSNKLEHVSLELGLAGKAHNDGFNLWVRCMEKEPQAWEQMKKYNIQDVVLLEEMYNKLRPWIKNHPSFAAFYGLDDICRNCGSDKLERRGFAYTSTGKYQRYQCKDCHSWGKGTERLEKTNITLVA